MDRAAGTDERCSWVSRTHGADLVFAGHSHPDHTLLVGVHGFGASGAAPMDLLREAVAAAAAAGDDPGTTLRAALRAAYQRLGFSAGGASAAWIELRPPISTLAGVGSLRGWILREGELHLAIRDQVLRRAGSAWGTHLHPQVLEEALIGEPWLPDHRGSRTNAALRSGDQLVLASAEVWWCVPEVLLGWWLQTRTLEGVVDLVVERCRRVHEAPVGILVATVT